MLAPLSSLATMAVPQAIAPGLPFSLPGAVLALALLLTLAILASRMDRPKPRRRRVSRASFLHYAARPHRGC